MYIGVSDLVRNQTFSQICEVDKKLAIWVIINENWNPKFSGELN